MPMAALEPFRSLPADPPPLVSRASRRLVYVCPDHPDDLAIDAGPLARSTRNRASRGRSADYQRLRWWCPMHPDVTADRAGAVCKACGGMVLKPRVISYRPAGQVLAVPQSAVVDTGARKVVFVESMPGMFDGVEVVAGPALRRLLPGRAGPRAGPARRDRRRLPARRRDAAEPQPRGRLLRRRPRRPSRCSPGRLAGATKPATPAPRRASRSSRPRIARSPSARRLCPVTGQAARLDGDARRGSSSRAGSSSCAASGCEAELDARAREIPGEASPRRRVAHDRRDHHLLDPPSGRRSSAPAWSWPRWARWAAWDTPVDAIPDLSENQVIVFTEWNGHGPREIEDQVTYPADPRPARAARRPGGAVVERRRLLDDQRDLRRRR